MINLKMELKECILLQKTIFKFLNKNTPMRYGGNFCQNPEISDEEYSRLVELFHKLNEINDFKL